jgi:hypothetical protein
VDRFLLRRTCLLGDCEAREVGKACLCDAQRALGQNNIIQEYPAPAAEALRPGRAAPSCPRTPQRYRGIRRHLRQSRRYFLFGIGARQTPRRRFLSLPRHPSLAEAGWSCPRYSVRLQGTSCIEHHGRHRGCDGDEGKSRFGVAVECGARWHVGGRSIPRSRPRSIFRRAV